MTASNGDRCVACGELIKAGEIEYWQANVKQPIHESCAREALADQLAYENDEARAENPGSTCGADCGWCGRCS